MGLELSLSSFMQDDSKGVTVHMRLHRGFSLHLSQKKDLYAISSDCINERSLKNIALDHRGYTNTATGFSSFPVTYSFNSDDDFCHVHAE